MPEVHFVGEIKDAEIDYPFISATWAIVPGLYQCYIVITDHLKLTFRLYNKEMPHGALEMAYLVVRHKFAKFLQKMEKQYLIIQLMLILNRRQ